MATIGVYDACITANKENNVRDFNTGSHAPNLELIFGEKKLVGEVELMSCSKSEQRRHLWEDQVLRSMYMELNPNEKTKN